MEDSEYYSVTKFITLVVVLLSLHAYAVKASSSDCHFPAIYNFGDSNSDTGGLSAASGQVGSPYGETFFRQPAGEIFREILPAADTFSEALYTFDIGQNDLTAGLFLNMSTDEVKAYIPDAIDQFTLVVKNIYGQGGRSFWIHNTGPVGCLPYVLDREMITAGQIDSVGCAGSINEVCQFYNTKLKEAVEQLRKDLPYAAITYVDVYSVKYNLISHASKYGFAHPVRACCGLGGKYNYNRYVLCGGKIKVNGTEVLVGTCQNPSMMITWDGVHYTEAANKWIFDQIVDGSYSDPPNSLKMAS